MTLGGGGFDLEWFFVEEISLIHIGTSFPKTVENDRKKNQS